MKHLILCLLIFSLGCGSVTVQREPSTSSSDTAAEKYAEAKRSKQFYFIYGLFSIGFGKMEFEELCSPNHFASVVYKNDWADVTTTVLTMGLFRMQTTEVTCTKD